MFWVFAYGSLMADGWEEQHGCLLRCRATLPNYARTFDKASVESRGSPEHPAPTLRLVPAETDCQGVAFQFPDERRIAIEKELLNREGKKFPLRPHTIVLSDKTSVSALVPMYEGRSLIANKSPIEIAAMAIVAKGDRGNGVDYVRDIAKDLARAGVDDPVVTALLHEVERLWSAKEAMTRTC